MVPPILYADRRNRAKPVLVVGVALVLAVEAALAATRAGSLAALAGLMLAFFVAFNVLEAMLPSLVSRMAPARGRGVAIGVYNTTQTLGVFFGGLLGGWIGRDHGAAGVFWACAALCAVWLAVAAGRKNPPTPPPPPPSVATPPSAPPPKHQTAPPADHTSPTPPPPPAAQGRDAT